MIELKNNSLSFRFPEVHPKAGCSIEFQRTLRIPDDNNDYPLPPGLGRFPIEHVDDHASNLPAAWRKHGGVLLPMYQAEAMWINFNGSYPCAIKIASGKINAVTGKKWTNKLKNHPQDYVVTPEQPWLDGFSVAEGYIRQFVAMPLGKGYSAEEQITGKAEHGGLQIVAYPMKRKFYEERFERLAAFSSIDGPDMCLAAYSMQAPDMGLAPGGLMRQKIYEDEYGIDAWDQENGFRCFVHLANSAMYQAITGKKPPHEPPTAESYASAGLPWFDHYSDSNALPGSKKLAVLTSVGAKHIQKGKGPLPDNQSVEPTNIKTFGAKNVVRDGLF